MILIIEVQQEGRQSRISGTVNRHIHTDGGALRGVRGAPACACRYLMLSMEIGPDSSGHCVSAGEPKVACNQIWGFIRQTGGEGTAALLASLLLSTFVLGESVAACRELEPWLRWSSRAKQRGTGLISSVVVGCNGLYSPGWTHAPLYLLRFFSCQENCAAISELLPAP